MGSTGSATKVLVLALAAAAALAAQDRPDFDLGPSPTRNLYTPLQPSMTYEPQSPFLTGVGRWRISFQVAEANIQDASLAFAGLRPYGLDGRKVMTKDFFAWMASQTHENFYPFLYWYDEETTRASLQVRTGLAEGTDLWIQVNGDYHGGGLLDTLAETAHELTGSHQWMRRLLAKDQRVLALASYGTVTTWSQGGLRPAFQDPQIGLVQRLVQGEAGGLTGTLTFQAPLSRSYALYKSGWGSEAGLSGWWKGWGGTFLYGGAYTHRAGGNEAYQSLGMTDDWGAHAGWQFRDGRKVQPYVQLYWLSGFARQGAQSDFHKASLQADTGVNLFFSRKLALTLRYVNNLSCAGNTDDFQLALGLTARL